MTARFRLAGPLSPALFLLLACCSETPEHTSGSEQNKPPEPISAQSAFYKTFFSARVWAPDAQPIRVAQIDVEGVKAVGGKAAAWEALFVSQKLRESRRYIWSAVHRPVRNLRGGVTSDPPEGWSGASGAEPFVVQAFRTDSTAAWDVAMRKGKEYSRKHPGQSIGLVLERTKRFPNPAWRVYWGDSVAASRYTVFVDATTGDYLATAE